MRSAIAFVLFSTVALAQSAPSLQFRGPANAHAAVEASPATLDAAPGAKVALTLDVTPKPGVHVYAPGTKDFIPIELKLDMKPEFKAGKTAYPKSELMTFGDEKVPVFQKPFKLTNDVVIAKSVKAGSAVTVSGTVHLQACDDKVCYPPENVPVSWTVNVK
jgi:DsbC/DsbD-like thiol-disulfide interchange protein